ncbi:MAG TPA: hypothetical protein VGE45_12940 [Chloroflexia bacterium]|jgi:hypothetical protein
MFDSLAIRPLRMFRDKDNIDVGFLAEALLFYQQVHVAVSKRGLNQLIKICGPDALLELLKSGHLKMSYLENGYLLGQDEQNGRTLYFPGIAKVPGQSLQEVAWELFIDATGRPGRGKRLASSFCRFVDVISYDESFLDRIAEDYQDKTYMHDSVVRLLEFLVPEYRQTEEIVFQVSAEPKGSWRTMRLSLEAEDHIRNGNPNIPQSMVVSTRRFFTVRTNVNFDLVEQLYSSRYPTSLRLTLSHVLDRFMYARDDLEAAARTYSELAVDPFSSEMVKRKISRFITRHAHSEEQFSQFQDVFLKDARAIKEAVNSGERSFYDVMKLLEKARKFKHWLKGQPTDIDLVTEYFREVTSDSWVDKLQSKTLRWILFDLSGVVLDKLGWEPYGTLTGVALSVADAFLLDSIATGWRPSQFVNGPLRAFVSKQ